MHVKRIENKKNVMSSLATELFYDGLSADSVIAAQPSNHGMAPPFQFPPHHLRILSDPNSAYSSRVTTIDEKLSVILNLAIPCQGSNVE